MGTLRHLDIYCDRTRFDRDQSHMAEAWSPYGWIFSTSIIMKWYLLYGAWRDNTKRPLTNSEIHVHDPSSHGDNSHCLGWLLRLSQLFCFLFASRKSTTLKLLFSDMFQSLSLEFRFHFISLC